MTWLILAYVASAALSTAVSSTQLARGCVERIPWAPNSPTWNGIYKGGTTTGIAVGLQLWTPSHPKTTRALTVLGIGANVAVSWHDSRQRCN